MLSTVFSKTYLLKYANVIPYDALNNLSIAFLDLSRGILNETIKKYKLKTLAFLILIFSSSITFSQTIELEYLPTDYSGNCVSTTDCSDDQLCFGLKYTPASTGFITSYTLGFKGDCDGIPLPFVEGGSCIMNDNSSEFDACFSSNAFLLIASGNSGLEEVISGIPIILHTFCFDFEMSQVVSLEEDVITGLTISIDSLNSGNPITEFPSFSSIQLTNSLCPCNIELLSSAMTLDQTINCLGAMDSIKYKITPDVEIIVTGLPKGADYSFENNILAIYGYPKELGSFEIATNLSNPCDSILNFNLNIQTPTSVMIKSNCYLDIQDALNDALEADTIRIIAPIISNISEPIYLPENIFINLQNNVIWRIQN